QNKVADQVRKLRRQPADARRERSVNLEEMTVASREAPPPRVIAGRDLLKAVLHALPDEERRLAELRMAGQTWPEISAVLGHTPEARRKQLARALDAVALQLGLEDDDP